ncbi:MAG: hypothetical protein V3U34_03050 [candidate division NC10 bacterium]
MMNERLKRLERQNRILKWAGAALLTTLVVVVLVLQTAIQQRIFTYSDEYIIACGEVVTGRVLACVGVR